MDYSVLVYGAVGDGQANDGPAIQRAIDACFQTGGGRVVLDGGRTYLCGTVFLKSNVEFHIENGAVMKAAADQAWYLPLDEVDGAQPLGAIDGMPNTAVLCAKHAENIQITGFGMIHGNMEAFSWEESPYILRGHAYPRPPLVFLEDCRQVILVDFTL